MIWQAPWWAWAVSLGMMALWFWICWKLMPLFVAGGAVMFCIIYPGCHFQ